MNLIITDTNVFFDIIKIGALPEFFALDFEICTTDFVVKEILEKLKMINASLPHDEIDKLIKRLKLNENCMKWNKIECLSLFPNFETVKT